MLKLFVTPVTLYLSEAGLLRKDIQMLKKALCVFESTVFLLVWQEVNNNRWQKKNVNIVDSEEGTLYLQNDIDPFVQWKD